MSIQTNREFLSFYYDHIAPDWLSQSELDQFLAMGWYRMHQSIFTTSHIELDQLYRVHWLRFRLDQLTEHTSHKRLRKKNARFRVNIGTPDRWDELEALYVRYFASIQFDGATSVQECLFGDADPFHSIFHTHCIKVFDGDQLVAAGFFDLGQQAAASILGFFDPRYKAHSLGKYLILLTIDYLRANGYEWYYPGYVVEGLSKMDYKLFLGKEAASVFRPELNDWVPVT